MEFERVVPASGNMQVAGRQFWLGPQRSGMTVTFRAGTDVIHLLLAGARIKSLRSHLSAADLAALAAQGGRRVAICIEESTLMFFDPQTRELLRTRSSPLTPDQVTASAAPALPGRPRAHRPSRSPSSAGPATPA